MKDLFGKLEDPDYFKVSTGHLWNFILKYHPERAQPIGQPVAKLATLEKIKNTNQTVCGFVEQEVFEHDVKKLRLDRHTPLTIEERVVSLNTSLFNINKNPSFIYLRECYFSMAETIMQYMNKKGGRVLLAGTRGIGKSILGLLLVIQLV